MNDPQWVHHEWGQFFLEWPPATKVGRKIAEGGQTTIYEVTKSDGSVFPDILLKVFRKGSRLSDLKKQWPCGILRRDNYFVFLFYRNVAFCPLYF